MNLTKNLIIQTAAVYSVEELKSLCKTCVEKLADNERILSASTGAGASYQMAERNRLENLIELYSAAINYKEHGTLETVSGAVSVGTAKFYL